jgi:hypothetical protein
MIVVYGKAEKAHSERRTLRISQGLLPPDALPRRARRRLADVIDFLTMHPDARRKVVRMVEDIAEALDLTPQAVC